MSSEGKGESKTLKYFAAMTCEGCSGAITRILKKIDGVGKIKCDIEKKLVEVTGTMDEKYVTAKLLKWSKASSKEVRLLS
eukprot:CAMPEP_0114495854 /NCGR_PEP_ID=MMETSP0109-20121206/5448_1 /TAXON_ID=29199 /ORGANISM="Chlorarachnion reptans, Strain CCCM449" /LENGTH=79 /DNA_ID=CAMNT_0001673067 /DNA_START=193 /DNA_END=432 /DNA_ORIENTATION=-